MGGFSYIELPKFIENKRATINPQNTDQECFKWAVLVRHVTRAAVYRVGGNYRQHEYKYNFDSISFPPLLSDIAKFEKSIRFEQKTIELLETFGIPTTPVIFRGSENNQDVAKHFVRSIVEIAKKNRQTA